MSISVIIPVYQAERFLEKSVLSACDQPEVSEVILVEDGSKDKSLAICERLEMKYSPRVKLYRHRDGGNHGAGASRNLGISKAECEFIAFLDADDYYLNARFKNDLKILQYNQDIDGVYNATGITIYDSEEKDRIKFNLTTVRYKVPSDKLFEKMGPIGGCGHFHCDSVTVRKRVFIKVGLFNESLVVGQDTHMWIKMAAKSRLVAGVIDKPLALRGVHSENRVKDIQMYYQYRPLLFSSLIEWAESNNLPVSRLALLYCCQYGTYRHSMKGQQGNALIKRVKIYSYLIKLGITRPYIITQKRYLYSLLTGWL